MALTAALTASLRAPSRSFAEAMLWALALSLVLVLSARISLPFWPVPMTMQPLALLIVAGLAGPPLAVGAVAAYLLEGVAGLPVFAGTPAHGVGLAYMAGPTGGYLLAMLPAAWVAGQATRHLAQRPVALFAALCGAIAVIYAGGAAWLALFVGVHQALVAGVLPFVAGDLVKAALACALLAAHRRRLQRA